MSGTLRGGLWRCGSIGLFVALCCGIGQAATLPAEIDLGLAPGSEGTPITRMYPMDDNGFDFAMGAGNQAVAVGDFNGDGFDDIAIGYPEADRLLPDLRPGAGAVVVRFGGPDIPTGTLTLNPPTLPDALQRTIYFAPNAGAQFGFSLAAGDLTGDGRDELVVGAPGAQNGRGVIAMLQNITPSNTQPVSMQDFVQGGGRIEGDDPSGQFGYAVAVGDFTGDGRDDILVSTPQTQAGDRVAAGRVYAVNITGVDLGAAAGIQTISTRYQISGGAGWQIGKALGIGDINGDGFGDLVIGFPDYSGFQGAVRVVPGGSHLAASLDFLDFASFGAFTYWGHLGGLPSLGFSLSVGDVDKDGFDDILIGAPLYTPEMGPAESGAAALVLGYSSIIGDLKSLQNVGTYGGALYLGGVEDRRLGTTVALGDLDGDGGADLIIGSAFEAGSGDAAMGGRVRVVRSSSVSENLVDLAETPVDIEILGPEAGAFFGASMIAAGDMNGDGFADLIATAAFESSKVGDGTGATYVVYGAGEPENTIATAYLPMGDTPLRGIGGRLSPTARTYVQYTGGTFGEVEVERVRDLEALENLGGTEGVIPYYWDVTTNRSGWSGGTYVFEYGDADIAGMDPDYIAMIAFPGMGDQWVFPGGATHDQEKRRFTVPVSPVEVHTKFTIVSVAPVIALEGEAEITIECGEVFVDPGYTATSRSEGDLTDQVVVGGDLIPQFNVGTYLITYNVTDSQDRAAAEITRTVHVVDTTPPTLTLIGDAVIAVECGDFFGDPGADAWDDCNGVVNGHIIVGGDTVDSLTPGQYTITYDVSDAEGNAAAQISRTVNVVDTTAPTLALTGSAVFNLACNAAWVDPGASSMDDCDGALTGAIVVSGDTVDTATPGTYVVLYNVQDSAGNAAATRTRVVNVGVCGGEGEGEGQPEGEGEGEIDCVFTLDGQQMPSPVATVANGIGYFLTDDQGNLIGIRVTHNVQNPTMAHIHTGDVGVGGPVIINLGNGVSPIEVAFTSGQIDTLVNAGPVHVMVHSTQFPGGEIRGQIDTCLAPYLPAPEGEGEGQPEGEGEGQPEGEGEGQPEGEGEGQPEGETPAVHNADQNGDNQVNLSELLRIIQFYNSGGLHCMGGTEDGYMPGVNAGAQGCSPHASDYNPQDWIVTLTELLRTIQFYNIGGYHPCESGEDGFCAGLL